MCLFVIYFWLCWVFRATWAFSRVAVSRGCPLAVVQRLLVAMASLAASPRLYSTDSIVVAPRLSCSPACGIVPDQGLNLCFLRWQADSLPLSHQGIPDPLFLIPYPVTRLGRDYDSCEAEVLGSESWWTLQSCIHFRPSTDVRHPLRAGSCRCGIHRAPGSCRLSWEDKPVHPLVLGF